MEYQMFRILLVNYVRAFSSPCHVELLIRISIRPFNDYDIQCKQVSSIFRFHRHIYYACPTSLWKTYSLLSSSLDRIDLRIHRWNLKSVYQMIVYIYIRSRSSNRSNRSFNYFERNNYVFLRSLSDGFFLMSAIDLARNCFSTRKMSSVLIS